MSGSFAVTPSFSRYSHSSGEIEDYNAEEYRAGKVQNVYVYYKSLYRRIDDTPQVPGSHVT